MRDNIQNFILENTHTEITDLLPSDDILTSGILDSMAVMRLISFIEKEKNIKIPAEDLVIEHFISVDEICNYLEKNH